MSEKKKHTFHIGQIIYLLSEEAEAIVPAIVVEEQTIKKLDGHQVSWKVAVGPPNKRKEISSNNLKGELHTSLEDIRETMTKRLNTFINNLIDNAKKRTEAWYGQHIVEQAKEDGSGGKIDPAALMSGIEDNNDLFLPKSKTSTSPINPTTEASRREKQLDNVDAGGSGGSFRPQVKLDPNDPKYNIKQKLINMTMPDEEESMEDFGSEQEYVIMEDGRKVPVKFNINE